MSETLNLEIISAIESEELERARTLLRDAIKNNPSAEVYYLASKVAINNLQRQMFLNKTLELDPFYEAAHEDLECLKNPLANTSGTAAPDNTLQNQPNPDQAPVNPAGEVVSRELQTYILPPLSPVSDGSSQPLVKKRRFRKWMLIVGLLLVAGVVGIIIAGLSSSHSSSYYSSYSGSSYSSPTSTPDTRVAISSYACLSSFMAKIGYYHSETCADPSNFYPSVNGKINLYYRLISDGKPISGVSVNFKFYSKFASEVCSSTTKSNGIATCSIPVGGKGFFLARGESETFTITATARYSGTDVSDTASATAYGQ